MSDRDNTSQRIGRLRQALTGRANMLIVMQDNPDPDGIASAVALRRLAHDLGGTRCTLAHGGTVGRAENRELVHYLDLPLHEFGEVEPDRFALVALVDTQPGAGNNPLPAGRLPDIVVDHHPARRASRSARFTDIRSGYGATSTILWEYLLAAEITPDRPLATALLYGIRSDTQDFDRDATQADVRAVTALYPLANLRMLGQIQRGRVPATYYQMLTNGLARARVYGRCVVSGLGDVANPDMIAEISDLLLRFEGADWSLCYGVHGGKALLSLRTQETRLAAGEVARKIVRRIGTGGGHQAMAAGQIPLRDPAGVQTHRRRIEGLIVQRFLDAVGIRRRKARKLVRLPVPAAEAPHA